MEIFRDSFGGISRSPSRRVFGLEPSAKKIVVPIGLCTHVIDSSGSEVGPDFSLPANLTGADIRNGGRLIGHVQFVDTPNPAIDVNPFVILDSTSSKITQIDRLPIGSANVGDSVIIGDGGISGEITSLLGRFPFPDDISLSIQAFQVESSIPLGPSLQGSPVIMSSSGKTLGMLLGKGKIVLVCPFP